MSLNKKSMTLAKHYILLFLGIILHTYDVCAIQINPQDGTVGDTIQIHLNKHQWNGDTSGLEVYFTPYIKGVIISTSDSVISALVPTGCISGPIHVIINERLFKSEQPFFMLFSSNSSFKASTNLRRISMEGQTFPASSPLPNGSNFYGTTADIDGDGRVDFITSASRYNGISILRNTMSFNYNSTEVIGSASFEAISTNLPSGDTSIYHTQVDDLNADGKPDIIGVSLFTNKIYVYINQSIPGSISFKPVIKLQAKTSRLSKVRCSDINGDGKSDIIVSSADSSLVSIHINQSNGNDIFVTSFTDTTIITSQSCRPNGAYGISTEDLNNDALQELIVVNYCDASVLIYVNEGISASGFPVFSIPLSIALESNPLNVVVGDLNKDGKNDLVISHQDSAISIIQNNGFNNQVLDFTKIEYMNKFNATRYLRGYWDIALADINADSKLDIILAANFSISNQLMTRMVVNLNSSESMIQMEAETGDQENMVAVVYNSLGISVADFNHDGRPDMLLNCSSDQFFSPSGNLSSITNQFGFPTSMKEKSIAIAANKRYIVYPNPVRDVLYVHDAIELQQISIINTIGEVVYSGLGQEIMLNNLPAGIYYVRITGSSHTYVEPIIKD